MAGACADGVGLEVAADRLGVASHKIETQLGSGTVGFERLGEMEQRVEIAGHRPVIDPRVEIPKINDALWRRLPAFFEQLLPVLERFLAQRKRVGCHRTRNCLPVARRGSARPFRAGVKSTGRPVRRRRRKRATTFPLALRPRS